MAVSITQDFINNAIRDARAGGTTNPKDLVEIARVAAEEQFPGSKLGFHQTGQDILSFPTEITDPIHLQDTGNLNWAAEYGDNQVAVIYDPLKAKHRALSELQGSIPQVKVNPDGIYASVGPVPTGTLNPQSLDGFEVQKIDLNNPQHQEQAAWHAQNPEEFNAAKTNAKENFHGKRMADLSPEGRSVASKLLSSGLLIVGALGTLVAKASPVFGGLDAADALVDAGMNEGYYWPSVAGASAVLGAAHLNPVTLPFALAADAGLGIYSAAKALGDIEWSGDGPRPYEAEGQTVWGGGPANYYGTDPYTSLRTPLSEQYTGNQ